MDFCQIDSWISPGCYMDLLNLMDGFLLRTIAADSVAFTFAFPRPGISVGGRDLFLLLTSQLNTSCDMASKRGWRTF